MDGYPLGLPWICILLGRTVHVEIDLRMQLEKTSQPPTTTAGQGEVVGTGDKTVSETVRNQAPRSQQARE